MVEALAAILAAILGATIALWGNRYLRRFGKIRSWTWGWELKKLEERGLVSYKFSLAVFNDIDLNTGVMDFHIVLVNRRKQEILRSTPIDALSGFRTDALGLPSRSFVTRDLKKEEEITEEQAQDLDDHYEVELRGFLPTGSGIRQEIRTTGERSESQFEEIRPPWAKLLGG